MNPPAEPVILGVDVSKDWLDCHRHGDDTVTRIDNASNAIDDFLKPLRGAAIAIEATNRFHELMVARARRHGLTVYLISGYELKHYALSIRQRMRTDAIDAQLLSRYLAHEQDQLIPYEPKSPQLNRIWQLLKRRALLVQQNQQRRQSFTGVVGLKSLERTLAQGHQRAIAVIDQQLSTLSRELAWGNDLARLRAMPGVGELTALALLVAHRSGRFIHRDPFIAYLGLDVRTKDSGRHKGKRKLTKHGDGEYRRVLHCAAMSAARSNDYFKNRYAALQARGLAKTAALVVIARQLARLAFVLLNKQLDFDPDRLRGACPAT